MKVAIFVALLAATASWVPAVQGARRRLRNSTAAEKGAALVNDRGAPCTTIKKQLWLELVAGEFCVPYGVEDRPAVKRLLAGQSWEAATHRAIDIFYREQPEAGDFVTAGLFFGDYLPHLSRLAGASHRVWGFEPNSKNFQAARGTVWMSSLENVWMTRAGLGARNGITADFCVGKNNRNMGGESHIAWGAANGTSCKKETAPIMTIDDAIPLNRRTSVIHLDVENHELACLRGAAKTIRKWRPLVITEGAEGSAQKRAELVDIMASMGYGAPVRRDYNMCFYP